MSPEVLTAPRTADSGSAVAGAEFSAEQWARIDEIIAAHRDRPGALIPVLERVQDVTAYLPESVQRRVAAGLALPLSQVYGVVTFYSYFTTRPRGRHKIRVCLGTACHVAGATEVLAALMQKLDCEPGEMSRDGAFSLDVVRCLGACGLAPVVEVDRETFSGVRPTMLDGILRRYRGADAGAGTEVAADAPGDDGEGRDPPGGDPARRERIRAAVEAAVAAAPAGECRCAGAHDAREDDAAGSAPGAPASRADGTAAGTEPAAGTGGSR